MHNTPKDNPNKNWWHSLKGCSDESVLYHLWALHGKTRLNLLKKWIDGAKKENEGFSIAPRLSENPIKNSELYFFLEARRASLTKKEVQEEVAGFARCEYCWRFVPIEKATGHHRCMCHLCENDLGWVKNRSNVLGRDLNKIVARLRDVLRIVWPSLPPPEGWVEEWYMLPENLTPQKPVSPEEHIWFFLPHVHAYIVMKGGDPTSALSVLDVLDPSAPDEPAGVVSRRHHIHRLLAGEFSMYRKELTIAQVLLSCDEFRPQHGGARAGAGGRREGSGRPFKKIAEVKRGRGRPPKKKIYAA